MKYKHFILLLIALFPSLLSAQVLSVPDNDAAEKVKATTLGVVLKKEDPKVIKYYKLMLECEECIDDYHKLIEAYNANIESIVKDNWTFTKQAVVISEEKAAELKKSGDKSYTLLEFDVLPPFRGTTPMNVTAGEPALKITLANKRKDPICYAPFLEPRNTKTQITKGQITYQVRYLQMILQDCLENDIRTAGDWKKAVKARTPDLKTKTILLCKAFMYNEFIEKANDPAWAKSLGLTLKVVTAEELDELIIRKENNTAFLYPIYDDAGYNQMGIVTMSDSRTAYVKIDPSMAAGTKYLEEAAKAINK